MLEKHTILQFRSRGFIGMQTDVDWQDDSSDDSDGKSSVL